jgi:hypothetical protein
MIIVPRLIQYNTRNKSEQTVIQADLKSISENNNTIGETISKKIMPDLLFLNKK